MTVGCCSDDSESEVVGVWVVAVVVVVRSLSNGSLLSSVSSGSGASSKCLQAPSSCGTGRPSGICWRSAARYIVCAYVCVCVCLSMSVVDVDAAAAAMEEERPSECRRPIELPAPFLAVGRP